MQLSQLAQPPQQGVVVLRRDGGGRDGRTGVRRGRGRERERRGEGEERESEGGSEGEGSGAREGAAGCGMRTATAAATSAIRGSFLKPNSSTVYGSYFGAALWPAPARAKRIHPFSSPRDGAHSTDRRSATLNSRGPPERLASSVVQFHSRATRSPSKATVPSPAPTVIGTEGPGRR